MSDSSLERSIPPFLAVRRPIVVVGGGAIGAACADSLAQSGAPVLLLEKGGFGQGSSHGNCGLVSPSHILPLSRPGAVLGALKTLFRRNSPFQLHFQWDWKFWSWLWKFSRYCNRIDMLQAGHARQALLNRSRQVYELMIRSGVLKNCEWESRGQLSVYRSQKHFEQYAEIDELLRKEYGLGATMLNEGQVLEREPALKPGFAGAWHYDSDAHLRPDKLMAAWQKRLEESGVGLREHCEVIGLERAENGITGIVTTAGRMEVDQLVLCTGAWTRLFQRTLQIRIPIEPVKGYSITSRRPSICPTSPLVFEDHRVVVTPFSSGIRVGSTMEFAGYDKSIKPARLQLLTDAARLYLKEPIPEPYLEKWYGWRPMSADGVPMIGRVPGFQNVWMAAGHGMLGVSMAPSTGQLISELVTGKHPHIDPFPYRLERFR